MVDKHSFLAVFRDIDPAVQAVDRLRELGLSDEDMNIISGIPVNQTMLGRPRQWTNVPRLALGGAIAGFLFGAFLAFVVPNLYPIQVGRQGIVPGPPTIVVLFEMTMLGMMTATFLGVFLDSHFPSFSPKEYIPAISDGRVAILFVCPVEMEAKFVLAMQEIGAESVLPAEAQKL
jgi:Protein of unknown function (DUF3341)